ncbi:MAG: rod shape-determining protein RodA [Patescibacteria group bacterium]|jgi:rod shape determining protein RodA
MKWLVMWRKMDWWLMGAIIILAMFSISLMYSISGERYVKQILFFGIGLIICFFVATVDYHRWQSYAYFIYAFGVLILLAVLLFGAEINGTTGWFRIGSASFQPVELVKIFMLIALARYLKDRAFMFNKWHTLVATLGIVVPYALLVLLQPDLGSTLVFIGTFLILLGLTNVSIKQYLIILGSGVVLALLAWQFLLQPLQKERIFIFLNPNKASSTAGYNVKQAIISVGSGYWYGRGLGLGTQSQLRFLPERDTDFIFAVIGEELGFIGCATTIILLFIILWRIWKIMRANKEEYGVYFCAGYAIMIFIQVLINIGMNIGVMPVTGIPLPFVSAGGSSLLTLLLGIGMIQNYYIQSHSQLN